MGEWNSHKLGEFVKIKHGWAFKSKHTIEDMTDDPILVNIGNFKYNGGFRFESTKIKRYVDEYPKEYKLVPNDMLLIMTCQTEGGEILGIPGIIPHDDNTYLHNQRLGKVEILNDLSVDKKYLYWFFLTQDFNQALFNSSSGTKILHTAPSRIESVDINLPPLKEQRAIAEVLSSLDDKIDLLHRQNRTLEEMAQTLFRQWFIEEAKDEWKEKSLSDFGDVICGKTPSKKKPEYHDGEIPFIKIPDMHGNTFIFNTTDTLTEEGSNSQKNKLLPPKSICVSCIATVGLVSMNIIESQTNQQINSIVPKEEYYRYFLYLFMKSSYDLLHAMASGGTATLNLNTGNFQKMEVLRPNDTTLNDFHILVEPQFNKIFANQKQIKTLENTRDTLLPKLMSGEVRIKDE